MLNMTPAERAVLKTSESQLAKIRHILVQARAARKGGQMDLDDMILYLTKLISDSEADIAQFKALRGQQTKEETTADIIEKALQKANLKPKPPTTDN